MVPGTLQALGKGRLFFRPFWITLPIIPTLQMREPRFQRDKTATQSDGAPEGQGSGNCAPPLPAPENEASAWHLSNTAAAPSGDRFPHWPAMTQPWGGS